jgi:hypothetical protein
LALLLRIVFLHVLKEDIEQVIAVLGARRTFRVVLHAYNALAVIAQSFRGIV